MSSKDRSIPGLVIDAGVLVAIGGTIVTGSYWYLLVAPITFVVVCLGVIIVAYCRGFIGGLFGIMKERRCKK